MLVRDKVEVEYSQIYKTVGLGTTIWSPLASGLLTGKYQNGHDASARLKREELGWLAERLLQEENFTKVEKLTALSKELGIGLPQLGVAWCLKNPNVSTVILGASKPEQLAETLKSDQVLDALTPDIMNRIEVILGNKPEMPPY
jgi:aryl-alcohol dehydrogenase-like predicted oxidoreductase